MTDLRERVAWAIEDASDWLYEEDELYRMADAALAEIGGVMVKPLEWTQIGDGKGRDIYSTIHWANSPYGRYCIGLQPRGGSPFDWSGPNNSGKREFVSMDEAKAAAQADYEARILAAIEPAPVSVREADLDAAASKALFGYMDRSDRYASGVQAGVTRMCAALRAIAEGKDDE